MIFSTRKQRRQHERERESLFKKMNNVFSAATDSLKHRTDTGSSKRRRHPPLANLISDFTEPLYDNCWSDEGIEDLYGLVCHCWNIGNCSEQYDNFLWDILIQDKLDQCFEDPHGILADELNRIILQRRSEFADDRRFIKHCRLAFLGDDRMNLQVTSTRISQERFLAQQATNAFEEEIFEA